MSTYLLVLSQGFPGGAAVKNLPADTRDTGSTPGSGGSPGGGNGNPLQYSCLEKGHHQIVNTEIRVIYSLQPVLDELYTVSKNKT